MTKDIYSSTSLAERQQKIEKRLAAKRNEISQQWDMLVAPPKSSSNMQQLLNQAERAVAIYDGVMTGYKIIKRFNSFFKRTKRNKKTR